MRKSAFHAGTVTVSTVCAAMCIAAGSALGGVTTLSASMTADNQFTASISTSAGSAGSAFLSGTNWPSTYSGSTDLSAPGTYYLHIRAEDVGRPAMFIGNFSLSGTDATFANGTQNLLTSINPGDWSAALDTYGGTDVGVVDIGPNGTSPWGNYAAMGDARFIWATGSPTPLVAYFTTVITVVPAPGAASLVLLGLAAASKRHR